MKDKLTANEIAELLSRTKTRIKQRAKKEGWYYTSHKGIGGKERRYYIFNLPEDVQAAYAASVKIPLSNFKEELRPRLREKKVCIPRYSSSGAKLKPVKIYDSLPEKYREIADCRRQVIQAYSESDLTAEKFVEAFSNGEIAADLRVKLGRYGKIKTAASLYIWLAQYEKNGLAGLAPQYSKHGGYGATLPEEVKDRLEWLYLDSSQPNINAVYGLLAQYNLEAGESTVRRYLNSLPEWIKAKYRKGKDYFNGKFNPYIIRNYENYKPMEIICGDYMTQDIVCRRGDKVFRARLCAFEDMRSRAIVGWSLQETASSVGVIRALQMAFENYGLPETIYVDNGKEFKNYLLCGDQWKAQRTKIDPELLDLDIGILAECGIKIIFCQPYHGQSKPIERFWGFFHECFDKFELTYMGSNTASRPDEAKVFRNNVEDMKKVDISLIPTFEEIEERIRRFIKWYNEKWNHSGQGMDDRTPMRVFAEYAIPKREIPGHLKKYLFTMRYVRVVQRNGVDLDKTPYVSQEFARLIGEKVEVRRGLDNAGIVHIFSYPEREYLFDAEHLTFTGVVEEDIRKITKLRSDMRELEKKHNRKKAEYDKGVFKTQAESYAEETEEALKVVGGEPLNENAQLNLKIVTTKEKPTAKKKYKGIFDVN